MAVVPSQTRITLANCCGKEICLIGAGSHLMRIKVSMSKRLDSYLYRIVGSLFLILVSVGFGTPWVAANTPNETEEASAGRQPDPSSIRLRSIRGITQRFPLFFGTPAPEMEAAPDAVVVVLMSPGCPVVNQYITKLSELHQKYNYSDRDIVRNRNFFMESGASNDSDTKYSYPGDRVRFLGVHPVPQANLKDIARHAIEKDIPFRVLHDPDQGFVRQYGETINGRLQVMLGQVLVFDGDMNLVYSGAINDQFAPGSRAGRAQNEFLEMAIESTLAKRPLAMTTLQQAASEPQGCIVRLQPPKPVEASTVNYYEHIQPLLVSKKCYHCHRPEAVGSNYELLSYDDIVSVADMIEQVISDRRMPPWPGHSPRDFKDESQHLMSDEEIALFRNWVRSGMAEGNPVNAVALEELPAPGDWSMDEPDFVFEMAKPWFIPESGRVDYVYYPVKMNLQELSQTHPDPKKRELLTGLLNQFPDGLFIEEIQVLPGSAPVVHHIQVHEHTGPVDDTDEGMQLNFAEQLMTYGFAITTKLLGSFTPGNNDNFRRYSENGKTIGMHVQPDANLLFELHYTPNGTAMWDQSKVGIRFARKQPDAEVKTNLPFRRRGDFNIPPNQSHFTLQDVQLFEARNPIQIERIRPHMHVRGKSLLIQIVRRQEYQDLVKRLEAEGKHEEAIVSDPALHGKKGIAGETLLMIPVWDFEWQRTYRFEKPVILMPGDVLVATGYFDNTRFNTGVTNYAKNIPWGQQVEQEMFSTLFIYRELDESDVNALTPQHEKSASMEAFRK